MATQYRAVIAQRFAALRCDSQFRDTIKKLGRRRLTLWPAQRSDRRRFESEIIITTAVKHDTAPVGSRSTFQCYVDRAIKASRESQLPWTECQHAHSDGTSQIRAARMMGASVVAYRQPNSHVFVKPMHQRPITPFVFFPSLLVLQVASRSHEPMDLCWKPFNLVLHLQTLLVLLYRALVLIFAR